jgi:hypothetical protein
MTAGLGWSSGVKYLPSTCLALTSPEFHPQQQKRKKTKKKKKKNLIKK